MFICQYCGKEVGNKGALINHENACDLNPNKIKNPNRKGNGGKTAGHKCGWEGKTKGDLEFLKKQGETYHNKILSGEIIPPFLGKHHTNETKKLLSEKRKQWLKEHPNEHVWKRNTKFISEPCENFKKYLLNKGINFVEEYTPFDDINYCLDIAWPDEKIAIEINGNQHYDSDGNLSKYYLKRHKLLEQRGWKIIEIHYAKCYNIQINDFQDILNLPIYDKDYVGKYFAKKELKLQKLEKEKKEKDEQKHQIEENHKQIIYNLINNSGIDFSKSGWSTQATKYLQERGELWNKVIFRCIRKYYPEFLQRDDIYKRKGSKFL